MFVNTLLLILSLWGTGGLTTFAVASEQPVGRNYSQKLSEESLDVACRCRLNELDELEGLWCTVATVHLARELNE